MSYYDEHGVREGIIALQNIWPRVVECVRVYESGYTPQGDGEIVVLSKHGQA